MTLKATKGINEGLIQNGYIVVADTIEELAEGFGLPAETLKKTVERQNENHDAGVDPDFGKDAHRLSAICTGVDVNKQHQCLNEVGEPIEGLYAVGNCSGGFYGGVDYPLTVGGLSIGRCYTEGYVTGKLVASL